MEFFVDEMLVLWMTLYVRGDELAPRYDMKVFTFRILQRRFGERISKPLPFRRGRHFGVSEEDVIALTAVLSNAELVAGGDFEPAFRLVVADACR